MSTPVRKLFFAMLFALTGLTAACADYPSAPETPLSLISVTWSTESPVDVGSVGEFVVSITFDGHVHIVPEHFVLEAEDTVVVHLTSQLLTVNNTGFDIHNGKAITVVAERFAITGKRAGTTNLVGYYPPHFPEQPFRTEVMVLEPGCSSFTGFSGTTGQHCDGSDHPQRCPYPTAVNYQGVGPCIYPRE